MIRRLFVAVLVLAATLLVAGLLLPAEQVVQRSLTMAHAPERIWPLLAEPLAWNRWSPWFARDPNMKIVYDGAPSGVGARWRWNSESEGSGHMQIIGAVAPRHLDYAVSFGTMGEAVGKFVLEPTPEGTRLIWRMHSNAGMNPIARWLGLGLERWVGPDLEQGLRNINRVLAPQGQPAA